MIKEMNQTAEKLEGIKKGIDSVAGLLEKGIFNTEDAIKILKRISSRL